MALSWLRVWTQVPEIIYFSHYKNYIGINYMKKVYNVRCLWVWLTREFKFIYNIIFSCQVSDSFILISLLANKRLQHTGINMLRLFIASNQIVFFISFIHSDGGMHPVLKTFVTCMVCIKSCLGRYLAKQVIDYFPHL